MPKRQERERIKTQILKYKNFKKICNKKITIQYQIILYVTCTVFAYTVFGKQGVVRQSYQQSQENVYAKRILLLCPSSSTVLV